MKKLSRTLIQKQSQLLNRWTDFKVFVHFENERPRPTSQCPQLELIHTFLIQVL